jgi:hypothetical protein
MPRGAAATCPSPPSPPTCNPKLSKRRIGAGNSRAVAGWSSPHHSGRALYQSLLPQLEVRNFGPDTLQIVRDPRAVFVHSTPSSQTVKSARAVTRSLSLVNQFHVLSTPFSTTSSLEAIVCGTARYTHDQPSEADSYPDFVCSDQFVRKNSKIRSDRLGLSAHIENRGHRDQRTLPDLRPQGPLQLPPAFEPFGYRSVSYCCHSIAHPV